MSTQQALTNNELKEDPSLLSSEDIGSNQKIQQSFLAPKKQEKKEEQNDDLLSSAEIKCKCGNPIFLYCSSQGCSEKTAICKSDNSYCIQYHHKCIQTLIANNVHTKINNKVIKKEAKNSKVLGQIQASIDKLAVRLSQMKRSVEKQMKTFGLNQTEYSFFSTILAMKEQQTEQTYIKGNFMNQFQNNYQKSEANWFSYSLNKFKSIIRQTKNFANSYFQQIEDCILTLHNQYDKDKQFYKYFCNSKVLEQSQKVGQTESLKKIQKLITSTVKYESLRKIFSYKRDQKCATNYHFDQKKLIQSLEGKSNFLVLIKNIHNKKMGFYCASKFQQSNSNWIKEYQKKSFLFSLDIDVMQKLSDENFSLKYDSKSKVIYLGQYFHRNHIFTKEINGFLLDISQQIPKCQLLLQKKQQQNQTLNRNTMFSNFSPSQYRSINGVEKSTPASGQEIQELQIYIVNGPQKEIFGNGNLFAPKLFGSKM